MWCLEILGFSIYRHARAVTDLDPQPPVDAMQPPSICFSRHSRHERVDKEVHPARPCRKILAPGETGRQLLLGGSGNA